MVDSIHNFAGRARKRESMAVDDYDAEFGYSLGDLVRSYNKKAYAVPDYEIRSLDEIEHRMKAGKYEERSECVEHERYLEDLQKRLAMILLAEEREGMMNWELREFLQRVRKLAAELGTAAGHIPEVAMYKESMPKPVKGLAQMRPAVATHQEPIMS